MPHLSEFAGLGAMIVAVTFAIVYLSHAPKYASAKGAGLLVIIIGVENQQSYNFSPCCRLAVDLAGDRRGAGGGPRAFPVSFRLEHRFLALRARFFPDGGFLFSILRYDTNRKPSHLFQWRRAFSINAPRPEGASM